MVDERTRLNLIAEGMNDRDLHGLMCGDRVADAVFAPQNPHKSESSGPEPTRNPQAIRAYPAHGGTAARIGSISSDQP